jgi:uncharacterized membrane protein YdjX (TVP38/TMEM64 family)
MECRVRDKPVAARGQWWRWVMLVVYLLGLLALALVWRQPGMRHWLDPKELGEMGRQLLATPLGPLAVMGGYVLAVMLGMPVLVLITVGALIFSPWPGMAYALCGMVLGAVVTYGFGRYTGAQTMDRWTQGRLALLSAHLKKRGLATVIVVRVMPVAPFIMVNMVAGALRVRLRDYVLGTALGLLPGTVFISLFMGRLSAAWAEPGAGAYAALAGVVVLMATGLWLVRRVLRRTA